MNICFVLEHFYPHVGGAETLLLQIAGGLAEKGHAVRVVTSDSGGISGTHAVAGVQVCSVSRRPIFGHPVLRPADVVSAVAWADIVHTATYTAAPLAAWAARRLKKPCVITVYEALGSKWFAVERNPLLALAFLTFERLAIRRPFTRWHAISEATRRDLLLQNVPPDAIRMIYPGVDASQWHSAVAPRDLATLLRFDRADRIFLFSGRPGKSKGLFVLLEAVRKAASRLESNVKFGLLISDDPPQEKLRLQRVIGRHGLEDRVHVAPSVSYAQLPGYRKSAFACVVPSITEGFGFSAAETARLGTPVVLSDAGSLPELASGRVLMFKNRDSDDLAEKLLRAATVGFDILPAREFPVQKTVSGILALYEEIIARP